MHPESAQLWAVNYTHSVIIVSIRIMYSTFRICSHSISQSSALFSAANTSYTEMPASTTETSAAPARTLVQTYLAIYLVVR